MAGGDLHLAQQLSIQNFNSLQEWVSAVAQVTAARQPMGQPQQGTPRVWASLADAAALFAADQIPGSQYELAKQWYAEGRLPAGTYTDE